MYFGSSSGVMMRPQPTPLMYPGGTAGTASLAPNHVQAEEINPVTLLACILASLALYYTAASVSIRSFNGPSLSARDDYHCPFRRLFDCAPPPCLSSTLHNIRPYLCYLPFRISGRVLQSHSGLFTTVDQHFAMSIEVALAIIATADLAMK